MENGTTDMQELWPQLLQVIEERMCFAWIVLSQNASVPFYDGTTLTLNMQSGRIRHLDQLRLSQRARLAKAVLADWDAHIDTHGSLTPGEARRDTDINDLRRQLAAAKKEITELNRQLTAATTVIASLHHDNQMLRTEHQTEGHVLELLPRPRG